MGWQVSTIPVPSPAQQGWQQRLWAAPSRWRGHLSNGKAGELHRETKGGPCSGPCVLPRSLWVPFTVWVHPSCGISVLLCLRGFFRELTLDEWSCFACMKSQGGWEFKLPTGTLPVTDSKGIGKPGSPGTYQNSLWDKAKGTLCRTCLGPSSCVASSPSLSCFPHPLTSFSQELFLNKPLAKESSPQWPFLDNNLRRPQCLNG